MSTTKFLRLNEGRTKNLSWPRSGAESGQSSEVGGVVRDERQAERERKRVEKANNERIADLEYQLSQREGDIEGLKKALKLAEDEVKQKDEELNEQNEYVTTIQNRLIGAVAQARSRLPVNIDKLDHGTRSAYCAAVGKLIQQEMLTNSRNKQEQGGD